MTDTQAFSATPVERLHGLDALRGGALLLGVVLHAAMAYFPTQIWVVGDVQTSPGASGLFFAIHLFRMTTFFLIAGLFGHTMLMRRGALGFVKNRLNRIAGPLVVFWPFAFAAIVACLIWAAVVANGGVVPKGPPPAGLTIANFPLTHLWFLWVLLILYGAMLLIRAPFAALDRGGGWGRAVDRATAALIGPWTPVLAAAPLALAFWLAPAWIPFFGIPTPDTGLMPNATALTAFGMAFGLGALLDRRRDLLARIAGAWPLYLVLAVMAGVAALVLVGGPTPVLTPIADPARRALVAVVLALAVQGATFAVLSLSLKFASGHSAVRRYLADASYWVYIVHLPLVMVGQVLMLPVAAPWWVKLIAVVAGTLTVALGSYALLIRPTFMGKWLNGRRVPWRCAKPRLVPALEQNGE